MHIDTQLKLFIKKVHKVIVKLIHMNWVFSAIFLLKYNINQHTHQKSFKHACFTGENQ